MTSVTRHPDRRVALAGAFALAASLVFVVADASAAPGDLAFDLAGETAVEGAVTWSMLAYPDEHVEDGEGPTEVLVGRDDVFADNLASGSLQGGTTTGRPLLLTASDGLDAEVQAELARLGGPSRITTVHLLGGTAAVSDGVKTALEALGYTVNRFAGPTRSETAIDVARRMYPNATSALLVRSTGTGSAQFADSMGGGAWASDAQIPVLFSATEALTAATGEYLNTSAIQTVFVLGGTAAISETVVDTMVAMGKTVTRVAGTDRVGTANAVNERRNVSGTAAVATDGYSTDAWTDGFVAANLAGRESFPVVLTAGGDVPPGSEAYLEEFFGAAQAQSAKAHFTDVALICGATTPDGVCDGMAALFELTVTPFPAEFTEDESGTVVDAVDPSYDYLADGALSLTTVTVGPEDAFTVAGDDATRQEFFLAAATGCDSVSRSSSGSPVVQALEPGTCTWLVTQRSVCYQSPAYPDGRMELLFDPIDPDQPGSVPVRLEMISDRRTIAPITATTANSGEAYFVVTLDGPDETLHVTVLEIDGVTEVHDFRTYITPTEADAGC